MTHQHHIVFLYILVDLCALTRPSCTSCRQEAIVDCSQFLYSNYLQKNYLRLSCVDIFDE